MTTLDPAPVSTDTIRDTIKALCVQEPHIGRIERGEKIYEVRSYPISHRGPLVLCASKSPASPNGDPLGCTRCIVDITGFRPFKREDAAGACIPWEPGKFVWLFRNVRSVERVPVKGRLGIFQLDHAPNVVPAELLSV